MSPRLPLRDIRIVDLTMGWSGPLATRHLADMGAEVIKIESCGYPDWWRGWENTPEALASKEHEKSPSFNQINRNKLGITIDLTKDRGRALALQLVARADAVIENQAKGVMEKLGLSLDELRAANPSIIWLSLPAYGAAGPWSGYRGYGSTVEHGAGLPHLTGEPDGPPIQTHVAYGDACGGLNAVAALLTGLFHRKRTGEGQRIDISQVEGMLQQGVHGTIAQGLTGAPPVRTGNSHPVFTPQGCFACAEPDSWLVVAVTEDAMWPSLCKVIERPDLADDPSLASVSGRRAMEDAIEDAIAAWAGAMDANLAMTALQNAGVAAGVAQRPTDLLHDPGYVARGFWQTLDRDVVGTKPHPMSAWRFNGERGFLRAPSPLLGEHNQQILGGILGLDDDELAELEDAGIIGTEPIAPERPKAAKS
ncbi:MAG: CoA transferase [Rhodospirillaceae bacterium]|nr:CoA transferase [Rhodospirillaceae bacterium]